VWYVYVLLCSDNSFYCGITKDIERRLKQHNGVKKGGAKYTRGRRPCIVIYKKKASDRSEASKKEYSFKKLNRKNKEKFLLNYSSEELSSDSGSTLSSQSTPESDSGEQSSLCSPPETSWSPAISPASPTP
jgi:putative endonuclease